MHDQAEAEMLEEVLVTIEIFPQGPIKLAVGSTQVAAAPEDVENFAEMRQSEGAGFNHDILSRRMGRATRVASGRG